MLRSGFILRSKRPQRVAAEVSKLDDARAAVAAWAKSSETLPADKLLSLCHAGTSGVRGDACGALPPITEVYSGCFQRLDKFVIPAHSGDPSLPRREFVLAERKIKEDYTYATKFDIWHNVPRGQAIVYHIDRASQPIPQETQQPQQQTPARRVCELHGIRKFGYILDKAFGIGAEPTNLIYTDKPDGNSAHVAAFSLPPLGGGSSVVDRFWVVGSKHRHTVFRDGFLEPMIAANAFTREMDFLYAREIARLFCRKILEPMSEGDRRRLHAALTESRRVMCAEAIFAEYPLSVDYNADTGMRFFALTHPFLTSDVAKDGWAVPLRESRRFFDSFGLPQVAVLTPPDAPIKLGSAEHDRIQAEIRAKPNSEGAVVYATDDCGCILQIWKEKKSDWYKADRAARAVLVRLSNASPFLSAACVPTLTPALRLYVRRAALSTLLRDDDTAESESGQQQVEGGEQKQDEEQQVDEARGPQQKGQKPQKKQRKQSSDHRDQQQQQQQLPQMKDQQRQRAIIERYEEWEADRLASVFESEVLKRTGKSISREQKTHTTVLYLAGPDGSGKSTLARALVLLLGRNSQYRGMWLDRDHFGSEADFTSALLGALGDPSNTHIIVDNTNLTEADREAYKRLCTASLVGNHECIQLTVGLRFLEGGSKDGEDEATKRDKAVQLCQRRLASRSLGHWSTLSSNSEQDEARRIADQLALLDTPTTDWGKRPSKKNKKNKSQSATEPEQTPEEAIPDTSTPPSTISAEVRMTIPGMLAKVAQLLAAADPSFLADFILGQTHVKEAAEGAHRFEQAIQRAVQGAEGSEKPTTNAAEAPPETSASAASHHRTATIKTGFSAVVELANTNDDGLTLLLGNGSIPACALRGKQVLEHPLGVIAAEAAAADPQLFGAESIALDATRVIWDDESVVVLVSASLPAAEGSPEGSVSWFLQPPPPQPQPSLREDGLPAHVTVAVATAGCPLLAGQRTVKRFLLSGGGSDGGGGCDTQLWSPPRPLKGRAAFVRSSSHVN